MFVNLTPHPVTIRKPDGSEITIAPSGVVARVNSSEEVLQALDGIPVIQRKWGDIQFGGSIEPDKIYIVSSLVLSALQNGSPLAHSMVAPDTGETALRDEKGQIRAVTRLVMA